MNSNQLMKSALAAAEDLLSRRAKLTKAIESEVSKLPPLIDARQAAERTFEKAELAQAAGEGTDAPVAKARAAVTASRAAIDEVAAKLRRLRGAVLEFGTSLAERHTALSAAIPAYNAALEEAFREKWQEAIAGFERLLGQRQAIEALTGDKMSLPEPKPTTTDLGPAARPHQVLSEIAAGIKGIAAATKVAAEVPGPDAYGNLPAPFDPTAIYTLKKPFREFAEGTKVVDCTFEENRLRRLVNNRSAFLAVDAEKRNAANAARQASQKIEAAKVAEAERRRQAKQAELRRAELAEQERRRPGSTGRPTLNQLHAQHLAQAAARGVLPNQ